MKNLTILTMIAGLMIGCSACSKHKEPFKPSVFTKGEVFSLVAGESTPFIFNGKLLTMTSTMTTWNSFNQGTVQIYSGNELISKVDTTFSLGSPIVDNGVLYVIGSKNWDKLNNSFYIISTNDLINWTPEKEIISSEQGTILYNNSVVKVDDKFIMSYEFCQAGMVCFSIKFKESYDLINWTDIGTQFRSFEYVACPALKYVDGYFYMFYAAQLKKFPDCETRISKSSDLTNWVEGGSILTPLDRNNEKSLCDSDFDFVEYNGKLEGVYLEGDQKTWFNLRRAFFNGTMQDLIKEVYDKQ